MSRVTVRYLGAEGRELPGFVYADPSHVLTGDEVTLEAFAADALLRDAPDEWEAITSEEAELLRGAALDDALTSAGLSKSGTVAEKRARLTEHDVAAASATDDPEGSDA